MKYSHKITKYNPSHTKERLQEEWTSYHDIGKLVSLEKYLFIENKYIETVIEICKCTNTKFLRIKDLEIYDDSFDLVEDKKVEITELEDILRLVLREKLWFKLVSEDCQFHFGYDYYMYFVSSKDFTSCIENVSNKLYVENFKSPYL